MYTSNQTNNQSGSRRLWSPKIIFIVLGIVVLAEVIYAVKILIMPTSPSPASPKSVVSLPTTAKISLTSAKLNYAVGEVIPVTVVVDTGGQSIDGVDLIVRFDPKALEIVPGSLAAGKIFSEYPLLAGDAKEGLISISGVSSANNSFTGQGEFAVLNLKAKLSGRTSLVIDFQKDMTTASNLVGSATSKNVLDTVDNLELQIQ